MGLLRGLPALLAMSLVAACQPAPAIQPHGTVNELMIGILEPGTNVVGTAAFEDPEAQPSIGNPYAGWPGVESAAIAMAESAGLLLIPGRVCSNGQPAPVDQEDWIQWTADLRESGLANYEAARRRDQDALFELSEPLLATCTDCHTRYLDVDGVPGNRCMP